MNRRSLPLLLGGLPVLALFAILGWAVAQSGGNPGGLGINLKLGEVPTDGEPAPQFMADFLDGTEADMSAFKDKILMIDFWSSWCPPCRQEAPLLSQIYTEYKGKPLEFIGIAIWDQETDIASFVNQFNVSYPTIVDKRGRIAIDYGVTGIPEKYFVDRNGTLLRKFIGPMNAETLRRVLDELLAAESR